MLVYDAHGRTIELAGAGERGGEGTVHRIVGDPSLVANLYHANRLGPQIDAKLRVMLTNPPADPSWRASRHRSIAWVDGLLFADRSGRDLRGFTMPFVETRAFRQAHAYYDADDRIRLFGGGFTWRHLLFAARNLAAAVAAVHAAGHRVGDLRETNVLVSPTAVVTLIDCDSFQICDPSTRTIYPTRVATGDYLAPELHGIDFAQQAPDRYASDLFALAVLIFRFLMLGVHPFQARGNAVADAPTTEAKIRKGLFAFGGRHRGVQPPDYAPPYTAVPKPLQDLFERAFVRGHGHPDARPAADEWANALDAVGAALKPCDANANHVYARRLRSCPWCRTSPDPFPGAALVGTQVALQGPPDAAPENVRLEQIRAFARVALADGPITDPEIAYLRSAGTSLGLRSATIDRVVDDEARRTQPAPPPSQPPQRGFSVKRLSPLRVVHERRLRSAVVALTPILIGATLLGASAPVIGPLALAVVGLPALATLGDISSRRIWRAPLSFVIHLHRMLGHAARVLVPFAALAFLVASRHVVPDAVVVRTAGASASLLLVWTAALHVPNTKDPSAPHVRAGRDIVWALLAGESGRVRRPAIAVWTTCAALASCVAVAATAWWPLRIG